MSSSTQQSYKLYYDMIMSLPLVKILLKKNKKLEKKYKKVKIKNKALQSILYDLSYVKSPANKIRKIGKLRKDNFDLLNNNNILAKKEFVDDDEVSVTDVIFIGENMNKKENIVYDLVDDENELNDSFDEDDEEVIEIITNLKNELKSTEAKHAVKTEEETEEREGASEGTVGSLEEEEEEAEEEREGASGGTVGSPEEEEMEVEEVIVNGKKYYTTNIKNGIIYEVLPDDDIGPEIGSFKDGKAKFYKK